MPDRGAERGGYHKTCSAIDMGGTQAGVPIEDEAREKIGVSVVTRISRKECDEHESTDL
jgi:hypothetical protein